MGSISACTIRRATREDLEAIVRLTRARRRQLAEWEPWYWNPRAGIEDTHPLFLGWCIEHNVDGEVLVACDGDAIVGCLFAHRRHDHIFLDDFCVANERWADVGADLAEALHGNEGHHRVCVPARDSAQREWIGSSKFSLASNFFSLRTTTGLESSEAPDAKPLPQQLEPPPQHVFGTIDAQTPNGLRVRTAEGFAIGSASASPAAYDPGGPTTVIDRVVGTNRSALVKAALQAASDRDDVQVIFVVSHLDEELTAILKLHGATRPVELWQFTPTSDDTN